MVCTVVSTAKPQVRLPRFSGWSGAVKARNPVQRTIYSSLVTLCQTFAAAEESMAHCLAGSDRLTQLVKRLGLYLLPSGETSCSVPGNRRFGGGYRGSSGLRAGNASQNLEALENLSPCGNVGSSTRLLPYGARPAEPRSP